MFDLEGTFYNLSRLFDRVSDLLENMALKPTQSRARSKLLDSGTELEDPIHTGHLADIAQLLIDYDEPLSRQSAKAYNVIFDVVETVRHDTKEGDADE